MKAGIPLLIGALVLFGIGVWSMAECLSYGGWKSRSENLTTAKLVPPGDDCYPSLEIAFPHSLKIVDVEISGSVTGLGGNRFNFYAFDEPNYLNWKAGLQAKLLENAEDVETHHFGLSPPDPNQVLGIRLVVENPSAEELFVEYEVDISWKERASWGLGFLVLAAAFAGIGIILLIPARESIRRGL